MPSYMSLPGGRGKSEKLEGHKQLLEVAIARKAARSVSLPPRRPWEREGGWELDR